MACRQANERVLVVEGVCRKQFENVRAVRCKASKIRLAADRERTERSVEEPVDVWRIACGDAVNRKLVGARQPGIVTKEPAECICPVDREVLGESLVQRHLDSVIFPNWFYRRSSRNGIASASRLGTDASSGISNEVGFIAKFIVIPDVLDRFIDLLVGVAGS